MRKLPYLLILLLLVACTRRVPASKNRNSRGTNENITIVKPERGTFSPSENKTLDETKTIDVINIPNDVVEAVTNNLSPEEIFERNTSAVFKIYTSNGFIGGQGSGFFISSDGVALSNYHVFEGTTIGYEEIILSNGQRYKVKEVYYKSKEEDFIIFKVDISGVNFIKISNTSPKVGERIYTIGSPQGYDNTFSSGEISQIRNNGKLIQISAPIDHGSSGGVLLNSKGEAIGITSSGVDTSIANLNFAINIDLIKPYISEIISENRNVSKSQATPKSSNLHKIKYMGYEVLYNAEYRIPQWVEYRLSASEVGGPYSRKGKDFRRDETVNLPQADYDDDYKHSGWSRGHMAPSGDFKWNNEAMWDTFYYTNCCPQDKLLNEGKWKKLEEKVRGWAKRFGYVDVVTGPIVGKNVYGTLGQNKVVIPDAFFKAILSHDEAIGFVMYNHNSNENLQKCAMSVDELEDITGYDFFSEMDDEDENRIESSYKLKYWGL
jgi:serine protease Do